jgi:glycosyltransferase involved in cell wall biosynthesis
LVELVRLTRPTHLVVRSPILPLFRWALRERVALLPLLADSFRGGGLRKRLRHRELALTLNHPAICIVANHNIAASLDLHHIGVDNRKIVPYDWPAETSPRDFPAKKAPAPGQPFRLLYVGSIIETKGVGDLITAVALLRQQGRNVTLTIIGSGDVQQYRAMVARKGLVDDVTFAGKQPHSVVMAEMHAHGAVVVPSHSAYPEGLPMTLYEAICSRTPLLASDHPMFALRLRDGVNSLVFRERNPSSIAECVQRLMDSPSLCEHLSESAERTAEQYLCPLKFADLISAFLDPSRRAELGRFSIAHGMSA